ncbi:hypothetical protein DFQ28_001489 [Apophysomyces sp. BC1034]|nr:hypothetical protein DFQ30_001912 [Apophysomyces sp. BC1015]KAG0180172.1 hypothetical protein DFQ29_001150 [Apophysomyces sp. BC1021]KAG0190827.1 hypothetical protein DFQ28_001489 [Apophysomyces sp. BC1034]
MVKLPSYADLCDPHRRSSLGLYGPKGTAWGLWGKDDELGTLNLLTEDRIARAAACIRRGAVFPLNLPLDSPKPVLFDRKQLRHRIFSVANDLAFDDTYDDFNAQASTQWDGLRHVCFMSEAKFYGGVEPKAIAPGPNSTSRLGIHNMAQRGIAGRAVLLDYGRWVERHVPGYDPLTRVDITVEELDQVAVDQGVKFEQGDILLVRVGWTKALSKHQHEINQKIDPKAPVGAGIKACAETYKWFWDHHFAAVVSDNPSFEAFPPKDWKDSCHAYFLGGWGMPIGELAYLEKLADDSAKDKVYELFFTSAPLNMEGGVASPINGLCIK